MLFAPYLASWQQNCQHYNHFRTVGALPVMPREREFQLSSPAAYSLKCREDDDDALAHVRRKFFDKYGRYFVVRYGGHRMQTFHHVVQDIRHDIEGLRVAMLKV